MVHLSMVQKAQARSVLNPDTASKSRMSLNRYSRFAGWGEPAVCECVGRRRP